MKKIIKKFINANIPVWLWGKPGTGKSYLMEQIAKEMGYEPVIINCTNSTVYEDIVGYVTIMGDNYTGKVWHAAQSGKPTMVIFNEIDLLEAKVSNSLNNMLEERIIHIGKNSIKLPDDFRICATANTNGIDLAGWDTREQIDESFLSRFELQELQYDPQLELEILIKEFPNVKVCTLLRNIKTEYEITDASNERHLGTRELKFAAKMLNSMKNIQVYEYMLKQYCGRCENLPTNLDNAIREFISSKTWQDQQETLIEKSLNGELDPKDVDNIIRDIDDEGGSGSNIDSNGTDIIKSGREIKNKSELINSLDVTEMRKILAENNKKILENGK